MLYLFTDFGYQGPYIGQMKSKVIECAHNCQVIDLMHDVPSYNIKAGAYLLSAVSSQLPPDCVIVSIVDPRVGSDQKGVVLRADYRWYVGPDNGLFDVVALHAKSTHWFDINYQPEKLSRSFHGRDIYAPIAGKLVLEASYESILSPVSRPDQVFYNSDLNEIIYIDQFGNLMTGIRAETVKASASIDFKHQKLARANTFSDVEHGQAFFYENSQGLIEIAINCGNAQKKFSANIGDPIILND